MASHTCLYLSFLWMSLLRRTFTRPLHKAKRSRGSQVLNCGGTRSVSSPSHTARPLMPMRNSLQYQIAVGTLHLAAGDFSGHYAQKGILPCTKLPTSPQPTQNLSCFFQVLFSRRYINRYINRQLCMLSCRVVLAFHLDTNSVCVFKLDVRLHEYMLNEGNIPSLNRQVFFF